MKTRVIWLSLYCFLLYASRGVLMPYLGPFLTDRGFEAASVGLIMALSPLATMLTQPLWGLWADRAATRRGVLQTALGATTILALFWYSGTNLWIFLPGIAFFFSSESALYSLSDAVMLQGAREAGTDFGNVRLWGTVGFGLASLVVGRLLHDVSEPVIIIYAAVLLVAFVASFRLPPAGASTVSSMGKGYKELLTRPDLLLLWTLAFLLMLTMMFHYTYFSIHMRNLGATMGLLGVAYLLSCLSELPFLTFAGPIFRRLGGRKLLLIAGVMLALRWALVASLDSPLLLTLTQLLHGVNFIVIYYALAVEVDEKAPAELKASGQAINRIVTTGLARLVGGAAGGAAVAAMGIRLSYFLSAAIALVAVVIFGLVELRQRPGTAVSTSAPGR